jgi:DNA-binding GntR family transcriptional regulator
MSEEVATHIRERIFDGTLERGQRVPQDAIAAELGVSRLPVREALITLETEGLVDSEPHRGTFIVPIRAEDIEDHYRIYGMVQGLATARAATRITEPVLRKLEELHEQMVRATDSDELHDLNWEFHTLINKTGGSRRLLSVLRQLSHNLPRSVYEMPSGGGPVANKGHAKILAALRSGDTAAADAASREHVRLEGDRVVRTLRDLGVLADEGF